MDILFVDILFRWLHIVAAAFAVGGLVYGRFIVVPAMEGLSAEQRATMLERLAARLKNLALVTIVILVVSGSYNFYNIVRAGVDTAYHMAFGVKFLLALHIFGMLFLLSTPPSGDPARDAKRPRLMLGAVVSGLIVFLLAAYLRSLHG